MTFRVIDAEQRSPEWYAARAGRLTGSRAADMLATIKSGEAAARRDYRTQLVVERVTGLPQEDSYINAVMQRGIDLEPQARAAYEVLTGDIVLQTGFLAHDNLMVGCSLDGHVGDFASIVEIKCPKSATHLQYWRRGPGMVPTEHLPQITHSLWVTGAAWCDFVSYDDRFPPHLRTFMARVRREDVDIAAYEQRALAFLAEVDAEYQVVLSLRGSAQE